jgi:pectate lyase
MKFLKPILLPCLLLAFFLGQAQTYLFNSPEGYGSGVTGGGFGPITIVTTQAQLQTALTTPGSARILVQGSVEVNYISVEVHDKTLLGLPGAKLFTNDQTAGLSGILQMKSSSNVIIRNLTFVGPGAYDSDGRDCLTFDGSTKMWVDHCDFQDGMDGNFDNKGLTDNITISWCRFHYLKPPKAGGSGGTDDHRFSNLVGSDDTDMPADGQYSITWQYCWWDNGCVERMCRARNAQLHMLNCYWNTNTGKVLLGLAGVTDCYVENGVFAGSGTKYSNYGNGTVRLTTVGSTAPPANVGTAPAPSYTHEAIAASGVVSAVTGSCGAGATLTVTTAGAISSSCGTSGPTLTTSSLESQKIIVGNGIATIVYTWGGTATGVSVTNLPAGLTGVANTSAKTYTISGTPTAAGTYSITTTQASGSPVISSGVISLNLAVPTGISSSSTSSSATISWSAVSNATGYVVNFCSPNTGPAPKKLWDFTAPWTITAANADANLVLDVAPNNNRFNYIPATSSAVLKFANGTAVPDVAGLLFTQTGATKVRLGFGTSLLYLNGAGIVVGIPCAVGDKVYVTGPAGNATAVDRGYSVSGGTLIPGETSSFINSSGIMTQAGATGTWAYMATSTTVKITTVTGSMNIQKIGIGGSGNSTACKEYTVSGGSTTTLTIPNLTANVMYSYEVKATNGIAAQASAYSDTSYVTVGAPLGNEEESISSLISIYPNPSAQAFQVGGIQGIALVSVTDLAGKLVLTRNVIAAEPISVEGLVNGIYLVKIETQMGTVEKKFLKK